MRGKGLSLKSERGKLVVYGQFGMCVFEATCLADIETFHTVYNQVKAKKKKGAR